MKRFLLLPVVTLLCLLARSQDLPINPSTGLISIADSMDLKGKAVDQVKTVMTNWGHTLLDMENLKEVYKLDNSRQTETISINLPIGTILTQDRGNNTFLTRGTLTYSRSKTSGINAFAPTATFGAVKFTLSYTAKGDKLIFEFTNMEFSHDMVHYGRFEDEKAPQDNYNRSVLFSTSKKEWSRMRLDYFNNLKILARYLKQYITPLLSQQ